VKSVIIITVFFLLCFYNFGKKLAVLPELNRPGAIEINGEKIFVLDGVSIKTYALKDFRFLTKFGKAGAGPAELIPNDEIPIQMQLFENNLLLNSQSKLISFSQKGDFIREKTVPFRWLQIVPLGKNFVFNKAIPEKTGGIGIQVTRCSPELKELNTLFHYRRENADNKRRKITIPPPMLYLTSSGNKLFMWGGNQEDFVISVFDDKGNPAQPIKMPYQQLPITDSLKKEIWQWLNTDPRFKDIPEDIRHLIHFPEFLPALREIKINENKIYVQTYKKEKDRSEFFIFNLDGKLIKKVFLPQSTSDIIKVNTHSTFNFFHNQYYYLVENPDGENWELHMTEIE